MRVVDVARFTTGALRGHRLRGTLSLIGVMVGVTSVVLLTSLGEGARVYVTGEFAALGSNLLIATPGRTDTTGFAPPVGGAPHDLTLNDAKALERLPGVRRVAAMAMGSATLRAGDLTRDSYVIGTTPNWQAVRRIEMRTGRFLPAGAAERDQSVCVIGLTVERELFGHHPGLGQQLRVGEERFRVIGVLGQRGTSLGMNLDEVILIPIERHMQMFNETSVMRMLIEMGSHEELADGRARAIALLTSRHGEEDITVITQDSMVSTFSNLLAVLTAALVGIAAISLTVAGVGIMNVMLVSVSERTREIGLLKALGATSGQVLRLFLTEAATLSALGGVAGILVAWLLTLGVRAYYPSFPMQAPPWAVPAAAGVSLSVGMIFGALPARRAAALDPVAALSRR